MYDYFMSSQAPANATHEKVLETIRKRKAMPFLELAALLPIDDSELSAIVADLERDDLVRITRGDDVLDEIVAATPRSYYL